MKYVKSPVWRRIITVLSRMVTTGRRRVDTISNGFSTLSPYFYAVISIDEPSKIF